MHNYEREVGERETETEMGMVGERETKRDRDSRDGDRTIIQVDRHTETERRGQTTELDS